MRKPEVTRNIRIRKYTVKCVNTFKDSVFEKTFYLYQKPKDDQTALKLIKKLNDLENIQPVAIMGYTDIKVRAKQSIETFMKHATIIEE